MRSLDHIVVSKAGRVIRRKGMVYVLTPSNTGYLMLSIKQQHYRVHALVAEVFLGPRPEGMFVCHKDDVRTNNRLSNLYYGTHSENTVDSVRNGTHNNARKTHCKRGHEFTPENTYILKTGSRSCKACAQERNRQTKRRIRERRLASA